MTGADDVRRIADELRVIASHGLRWSEGAPYDRDRYERVLDAATRLFALTDERSLEDVERTVLTQLTHLAPVPCGDAAVIGDDGRILLIQRADDRKWAMPGGGFDMGETAAEGVVREAREETGVDVEVLELVGVWDSRFNGATDWLQLYQFVFLCRPTASGTATTPQEVLDVGWFHAADLPPLSAGHAVRIPYVFEYLEHRRPYFDAPKG
jgi:ADP-ribose pyrophosphatase YjhB (NUDIX family)